MDTTINKKAKKVASMGQKRKRDMIFYWSIAILPIIQVLIFYFGINIKSILLSFQEFQNDGISYGYFFKTSDIFGNIRQAALDLINEDRISGALGNSLISYCTGLLITLPLALIFSYYVMKKMPMSKFFRVILFMPSIICAVVLTYIYSLAVNNLIPDIIQNFSDPETFNKADFQLLSKIETRFWTILVYQVLTSFSTNVLMYSSAMSAVSSEMLESARIDGVTDFGELIKIVIPTIFPTITTFLVVGVANIFINQMFLVDFYGGQASPQTWTIGYYMYFKTVLQADKVAQMADYPYLAAMGLVFTLIIAPITMLVKYLLEKFGPSED